MVEIVAHNAPEADSLVKVVAAGKMTYVVAVKLLPSDDVVAEEDELVAASVSSSDASVEGMVEVASLVIVIQMTTKADYGTAYFAGYLVMENQENPLRRVS